MPHRASPLPAVDVAEALEADPKRSGRKSSASRPCWRTRGGWSGIGPAQQVLQSELWLVTCAPSPFPRTIAVGNLLDVVAAALTAAAGSAADHA